ncbi:MAG TPA: PKD domain-containing protein [Symbiobacteriaceae bacterium]|nr:PKD domain-containing protein [Symbiobacteriaceae bacterium]
MSRRLSAAYVVMVLICSMLFTLFPGRPAEAGSQFLWWSGEGNSQTTVGPNAAIVIWSGKMEYVAACLGGGTPDFIYPWTDIYIVPAGSVPPFGELEDVGGTPNTVQSLGTSGIFMDELIGQAAPGGKIPPGTYDIIFDECQDGTYDLQDVRFPNALTVTAPTTNVPPLPNMSHGKAEAEKHYKRLEKFEKIIDKLFQKGGKYDKGGTTYGYGKIKFVTVAVDPRQGAMIQLGNLAKHYKGIAADPPDPAFQQLSQLAQREIIDFESDDPLDQAIAAYLTAASNEGAVAEALLHSLERYQGADAANDGNWALLHAWAIQDNLNQLSMMLNRSISALNALASALAADPRPLDAVGDELKAFRDRVAASGFTADELLDMRNSDWDDAKIEQFRQWIIAQDFTFSLSVGDTLAEIQAQIAENNTHMTALENYWNAMQTIVNQLQNDPGVSVDFPLAHAGGPYTGNEGSPISFSGSGSQSATPIVSYEWDFDNDGLFDDATGVTPSFTFSRAFRGIVGLKVTNGAGKSNIAYAPITVNNLNRAPQITAHSPVPLGVTATVGTPQNFAVSVFDPDNDPIDIAWELDGSVAGAGASFSFSPSAAHFGPHTVEAKVWDSSPLGGAVRLRWDVDVLFPDDDNDGWRQNRDCDDTDPAINPGRTEVPGDGKDNDCNLATPDAPPVVVVPAPNQAAVEGVATPFNLGGFSDTNSDEPYLIDVNWGDGSAHASLTAMAPGIIGPEMHAYADSGTYPVTVTVTDSTGGSATGSFQVTVANQNPTAVLTAPATVNVGETFSLSLTGASDPSPADTAAGFTYAFDCGTGYGASGSAGSAACTATSAGALTVRGKVMDKDGGFTEYTATVQVNGPVAVTAPLPQTADEAAAASFDLGSFGDGGPDGPWTVAVDWGDGSAHTVFSVATTGALPAQAHTYADSGVYTATVTVTDATSQAGSASFAIAVANLPPTATFSAPASAVTGQAFAISLSGAADPSSADMAAGFTYAFDCGAGYGAFGPADSAACTATGTGPQTVRSKVMDKDGGVSEYSATVQVNAQTYPPVPLFNPTSSLRRNVAQKEMGATIHSSSGQYGSGYAAANLLNAIATGNYWATPNGQKTGWAIIDLAGSGSWMIDRIRVMPATNSAERVADFAIAVSNTGTADADFTTVLTATAANNNSLQEFTLPQPVMAKYVKYSVLTNRGSTCCTGTHQVQVLTGQYGGTAVTFQNLATDPDNDITSYLWDFGDGTTSTEASPSHTYAAQGAYPVTLTATDATGKSSSITLQYRTLAPPSANFTVSPATGGREGSSLSFIDTSTDPDGGLILSRTWKWSDGSGDTFPTTATTNHSFPDNGDYTITLIVTDDQGQTAQTQQVVTILNANPTASAGAAQSTPWGIAIQPSGANFNDTGVADRPTLQCSWNFGDGTTHGPGLCNDNAYKTPAHAWANPGTYQRNLTVTDKDGGTVTSPNVAVTVTKHNTNVGYHGLRTFSAGTVTLGARLRDTTVTGPIAGQTLIFTVNGQTLTGVTGADGYASVTTTISTPGVYPVEVDYAGDSHYVASARDHDRIWVGVADESLVAANGSLAATDMMCLALNTVTLSVTGTNPTTASVPLDIALVIDISGSMGGANIAAARTAARSFVQIVDRESDGVQDGIIRGSRIAVIPFNDGATVGRYLSSDAANLDAYIASLQSGGGTAIDLGITRGQEELVNGSKLGNKPVLILLSDGGSSRTAAYAAANAAKAAGTELFSIALGTGADVTLMQNVASDPKATHYFFSPSTTQLEQIYQTIADSATGPAATNVVVTVQVDPAFTVVPGSISPAPSSVAGNTITWTLAELKGETKTFTYQVQHAGPGGGPHTVNTVATVTFTDTRGNSRTLPFPGMTAMITCPAALSYQGALQGAQGQPVDLKALLTVQHSSLALSAQNVTFDLGGLTAAGQTDGSGLAHTSLVLTLPPGTYPLTARFAGAAGYPPAETTVQFQVLSGDTAPPVTQIHLNGTMGGGGWYRSDVTVTLTAVDHPAGLASGVALTEYSLDSGATWQTYAGPFTISGDGAHQVLARSQDNIGNQESPPAAAAVQIDATGPVIGFGAPPAGTAGSSISLDASGTADAHSGLDRIEWDFDGDGVSDATGPLTSHIWPAAGTYTVSVRARDVAGNESTRSLTVAVSPAGPCEPVVWKAPLSSTGLAQVSLTAHLPIRFAYNGCGSFVHDESVIVIVVDRTTRQEVTAWVHGSDIRIDDAAEEYQVTFTPGRYALTPGQELEIQVYIADQLVGQAALQMTP